MKKLGMSSVKSFPLFFDSRNGRKHIARIDDEEMNSLLQRAENLLLDALLTEEDNEN